ncbi:MAG: hypothetical protein H0W64_11485 [Gammaproteobacteria bacterium]|nr:hypothetical protein [Gammaproteobacteria bacterium]
MIKVIKFVTFFTVLNIFMSALYADTVNLDVYNLSRSSITIVKEDGDRISIPPNNTIYKIPFKLNSKVRNYIGNEYECYWEIKDFIQDKLFALAYGLPYGGKCVYFTTKK